MSDELPEGWVASNLGRLVRPSREKREPGEAKGLRYIGLEHIESATNRVVGEDDASRVKSTMVAFSPGDVLYSKLRPYLNKVALAPFAGVGSTEILVFEQVPYLDSRYLMHFLSRRETVQVANERANGVQLPRITFDKIADLDFPVPPLSEQRRIVAKVDELLAEVNRAKARLTKVQAILKRFRQSVLAAACSGELTREWRDANGGSTVDVVRVLSRHRTASGERHNSASRRGRAAYVAPPIETNDGLPALPKSWRWIRLGLLGSDPVSPVQTGPFGAMLHRDEFVEKGVPVIAVGNLTGMGFTTDGLYFVTREKALQLKRFSVNAGDLLFARSGATLGKVCVAPKFVTNWLMTGHILRARVDREVLLPQVAVYSLWGAPPVLTQVADGVRGATRPGYNTSLLEEIHIPVAPLEEQREIVRQVTALLALADTLEMRVDSALMRVGKIPQSILSKAFSGELVPTEAELARLEDRGYEPAVVLLERVKNASAAGTTRPKATRRATKRHGAVARS